MNIARRYSKARRLRLKSHKVSKKAVKYENILTHENMANLKYEAVLKSVQNYGNVKLSLLKNETKPLKIRPDLYNGYL